MNGKRERIYWMDVARTIAILLVVLTHIHEQIGTKNVIFNSLFYSITRLGVPVFLMLSGGLVLTKLDEKRKIDYKKILKFFLLLIFYSVITSWAKIYFKNGDILESFKIALKNYNGIYPSNTGGAVQLWYMYTIISFYLVAPYLALLLKQMTINEILFLILISTISFQLRHSIEIIFKVKLNILNMGSYLITNYFVYTLIGYLIINRNYKISKKMSYIFLLLPTIVLLVFEMKKNKIDSFLHWYSTSIFVLISSVGFFYLIKYYFEKQKKLSVLIYIAKHSFNIFLLHYLVIYIILGKLGNRLNDFPKMIQYILVLIGTISFSCLISMIIFKLKKKIQRKE